MKKLLLNIYLYIRTLANLQDDTDAVATIASIRKSIEFKGANVWILAFAVIVASVGLNVNSTAVIIGAMLISPLMGPINGIGLAIGIYDNKLLKQSLKNLITMVLISLLASTTYFLLSPLSDAQSELLARTTPTIYDVLIAFFGGMAGIVALSRKEQPFTIIAGVAIATALMPPLCTAGYGLANGHLNYFLGAFYLFFINSVFIAIATFLMVRYLRFPQITFLDDHRRRLVKRTITLFSIVVMVPSIFMAISVIRETAFNSSTIKYVNAIQSNELFKNVELLNYRKEYSRKAPKLYISFVGQTLSPQQIDQLHKDLITHGLEHTSLEIKQTSGTLDMDAQTGIIAELLDKKEMQIELQEKKIDLLTQELNKINGSAEVFRQIAKEIVVQYPDVHSFSVVNAIYTRTATLEQDTVPILFVNWQQEGFKTEAEKLAEWLRVRLEMEKLEIYSHALE